MALFAVDGVGEVIARHRQAAGPTVEQVARKVGVSARRFAMYESNEADIPDDRLLAFAYAVGVNPADLSLECLFHTRPELKHTPIGREFRDLAEWVKTLPAEPSSKPAKPAGKKSAGRKPATRTPPRRRVSR